MKTLYLAFLLLNLACGKKSEEKAPSTRDRDAAEAQSRTHSEVLASAVEAGDALTVEALLKKGVSPNGFASQGHTLLTFAIEQNMLSIAQALLLAGAETELKNRSGDFPIILSVRMGFAQMTSLLVANDADLNVKDERGRTALMLAILEGQQGLADFLVDRGADLKIMDSRSKTAAYYAKEQGLDELAAKINLRLDLEKGESLEAIFHKLLKQGTDLVAILDVLKRDESLIERTPLILEKIVQIKNIKISDELLSLGLSRLRAKNILLDHAPAVILATSLGRLEQLKKMKAAGIPLTELDESGRSLLVIAVLNYQAETVEYLLAQGLKKNYHSTNLEGQKIRHESCTYARQAKKAAKDEIQKDLAEKSMQHLGCGLRWIFW